MERADYDPVADIQEAHHSVTMIEKGTRITTRAARSLLVFTAAFFVLGIGMRMNRAFFEPIIKAVAPIIWSRRGVLRHYEPSHYEAYMVMAFLIAGVFLVLSGFAWMFSAIRDRDPKPGD